MGFKTWLTGVLGVLPPPPPALRPLPQTIQRSTLALASARRDAILAVLREAKRPMKAKEIMAKVRHATEPPVQPPRGDRACLHLLRDPPLRDMLILEGHSRGARWSLRPTQDASPAWVTPPPTLEANSKTLGIAPTTRIEVQSAARLTLLARGGLSMKLLLPLVQQRVAPMTVSRRLLETVLNDAPEVFAHAGKHKRGAANRWTAL